MQRFEIKVGAFLPLLALFGMMPPFAYVDVGPTRLYFRFGVFSLQVQRDNVAAVAPRPWPWYAGVGLRYGGHVVGLIGTLDGVVAIDLRQRVRASVLGIPVQVQTLCVSFEDPALFIAACDAG